MTMHSDRLEDVAWMAATGENVTGAVKRLGITRAALEKWCRVNAPEHWATLLDREPRDHNNPAVRGRLAQKAHAERERNRAAERYIEREDVA